MDRRDFLGVSASASTALLLAPPALGDTTLDRSGAAQTLRSGATHITRSPVSGAIGAIAAGNPITAATGARILAKGGNAVDAAVAAAFMAYVVEPGNAGLGGHGRLTVHMAKAGRTVGIDHYIRAPRGATSQAYQDALARSGQDTTRIAHTGHLAVGVFGTVAGVCAVHERFATLPLSVLMEEAIAMAETGPSIDPDMVASIAARLDDLAAFPLARAHLVPDGRLPKAATDSVLGRNGWERSGPRLDTTDLARTLKRIATEGAAAIYDGTISKAIDAEMRAHDGVLTAADLTSYAPAIFDETLWTYRDHGFSTCSDLYGPQFLNVLERFDVAALDPHGADYRHLVAEALALAFTDVMAHPADPADPGAPREGLSSKRYAEVRARLIRMDRAIGSGRYPSGDPWPFEGRARRGHSGAAASPTALPGTTSINVGDREGNLVSFITSLGSSFGSLVLVPGTGIYLGNAMQWFDPRPGRANSVAPGRMPPYFAPLMTTFREGRPVGGVAAAGGYRIATALFHAFLNTVDHRMDIQAALEHPRIHTQGEALYVDERIDDAGKNQLAARGHEVRAVEAHIARPTAVWRSRDGTWSAAADPIRGGTAAL